MLAEVAAQQGAIFPLQLGKGGLASPRSGKTRPERDSCAAPPELSRRRRRLRASSWFDRCDLGCRVVATAALVAAGGLVRCVVGGVSERGAAVANLGSEQAFVTLSPGLGSCRRGLAVDHNLSGRFRAGGGIVALADVGTGLTAGAVVGGGVLTS